MDIIKKGDIVGRKSYGKDIIFVVNNIIIDKEKTIAILRGITERVLADSEISDLEIIDKKYIDKRFEELEARLNRKIEKTLTVDKKTDYKIAILTKNNRNKEKIITGKILHLDGDKKYSEKSYKYYQKIGLNAVVKNIPEYEQPKLVYRLLKIYKPDILVITGHDRIY